MPAVVISTWKLQIKRFFLIILITNKMLIQLAENFNFVNVGCKVCSIVILFSLKDLQSSQVEFCLILIYLQQLLLQMPTSVTIKEMNSSHLCNKNAYFYAYMYFFFYIDVYNWGIIYIIVLHVIFSEIECCFR